MATTHSRLLVSTNIANLYAEASTSSEVVTQALMGMEVIVEEENDTWLYVQMEDRYRGWIRVARLTPTWDDRDYLKTTVATLLAEVYSKPDSQSEMVTKLAVSTRVSLAHRPEVGSFVPILLADKALGYIHKGCLNLAYDSDDASDLADPQTRRSLDIGQLKQRVLAAVGRQVIETGKRFIGTPYLWGGCSPFGIDCSGFVQLMYKLNGVQLLRDADIQFTDHRFVRVETEESLETGDFVPGDLLVFGNAESGKVTHIGLAMGDGRFIHSSGSRGVAIDPCDDPIYIRTYLGAARISPEADLSINAA